MISSKEVAAKVAAVAELTAGFVSQGAAGLVRRAESLSLEEMSRRLDGALQALRGEAAPTSGAATTSLPETKTAPTITIKQMKEALRAADCLYDDTKRWKRLGATKFPKIPNTVIQEAYIARNIDRFIVSS